MKEQNKTDLNMTEPNSILAQLLEKQKKQTFYTRIICLSVAVIAITVLIAVVYLVPRVAGTLSIANALLTDAQVIVSDAQASLENIDVMSAEITKAAEGINTLVEGNSDVLSDSVARMNSIDFEGLNSAIQDLQDVVEPMAKFFNSFR